MEQTPEEASSASTPWQARIDSWRHSGLTIAKWCREHNVNYDQFLYHKSKLNGRKRSRSQPVAAEFVELSESEPQDTGIMLECVGIRIRLTSNFDAATLLRCLQVLQITK